MDLTVQNVYGLLLRSKLLAIDEARSMYARWQEEARDSAANLAKFAGWMVANKYLTEYQASLLARGHAEGFFLNEYKVLDRLGKGRMAGVYKAQHPLGQVVAIKVLPPSKAKEGTMLARFQREARLALRLRHPNIVRAFQVGQAEGLHFLVMEHLEGETLEDVLIRRGKMQPAEAVRLVYQALQGLQHIHTQGLVHRDLKPSNLMLVPPPQADSTLRCTLKVLDMGLGRVLFEEGGTRDEDSGLTSEGVLLGTPDYMAPEQARDPRSTDIRADIYSLGCVLHHLLTGQPPFPDTNIISQMIRHATETPRLLKELNPAVPDGLQQIVNWMLAKAPEGRYPTPERAAQALEVFLAAEASPLSSPDLDPGMKPFLNWLEKEDSKAVLTPTLPSTNLPPLPSAIKPASGTMPAAPALPGKPPSATIPTAPAEPRKRKETKAEGQSNKAPEHVRPDGKRHGKKRRPPPPIPAPAASVEAVNVELVAMPVPAEAVAKKGLGFTRRDFLMYGAGVATALIGILIGYLLVRALSR